MRVNERQRQPAQSALKKPSERQRKENKLLRGNAAIGRGRTVALLRPHYT